MAKVLGVLAAALVLGSAAQADEHGDWQQVENKANCAVWNGNPQPNDTVMWSGACANGKAQGHGRQAWRFLFDGEWKEEEYTGAMKDGKFHGQGVYLWADGSRYEGDFVDGRFHGRGVFVYPGGERYAGDWKDGTQHGHGVWVLADGDKCEGDWRGGTLSGTGKGRQNGQLKNCRLDGSAIEYAD